MESEEFLEKVTIPADSEVVDEKGTGKLVGNEPSECKKTLEDHDTTIDDDYIKVDRRTADNGIDEAGQKWISIRAMRPRLSDEWVMTE